jgi:hypothetical protein
MQRASVLIGEVGLNFYIVLDEARPFGARPTFISMRDMLLPVHFPLQCNATRAPSTHVSKTRKRETCVLGVRLALGVAH